MTNITSSPPEATLAALGFTETEAALYCELLRSGPATGYRLAQAVGKAPANIYQALAALAQKGAVLVDETEAKAYRAIAPSELLGALQQGFETRRAEAQAALEALHAPAADDRIYHLKTLPQVYERARAMIARAREIILCDLFPAPLAELAPSLERAAAQGVTVGALVYAEAQGLAFPTILSGAAAFANARWPGLQLSLVVDASEHLVALVSPDGTRVLHGIWSDSPYLACLKHSGLASEIRLAASDAPATAALSLLNAYPPGLRALAGPRPDDLSRGDAA
jgi:predicted transcriptional regulator